MKEKKDKTQALRFRVTPEEKEEIERQAEICGLSVSEYIRRRIFGIRMEAKTPIADEKMIGTLRQIGGLLKQIFKTEKVDYRYTISTLEELNKTLRYIRSNRNDS